MSDKIELTDVASGYKLSVINENFQKIQDELNEKVLYRDNPVGEPNQMNQSLDMNGFTILNCPNLGGGGGGGGGTAYSITSVPLGNLAATNVQDALYELDNEKAKLNGDQLVEFSALTQPINTNNTKVATTAFVLNQKATVLPQPLGLFPIIGSSSRFALEDHVHAGAGGGGGEITAINNGQLYAYQRSATTLLSNPGDVTYDFTVGKITSPAGNSLANGWTKEIPAGSDPLYVCVASASNSNSFDTVAAGEWTSPVVLASNGTSGLNVATLYLYQRAITPLAPTAPSTTSTYTFSTKTLTGFNNGWSTTIPSAVGGKYLYVTTATAASVTDVDSIPNTEWAAVSLFVQDGTNGTNGTSGTNGANGQRGTVQIAYAISGSVWSNTEANNALIAAGYYPPQNRDIVTLYNTGSSFTETRFYDSGSWLVLTAYINGNLLVSGTLSADKINGGTISGTQINIGSSRFRVIADGTTTIARMYGGNATFDNYSNNPGEIPLTASVGNLSYISTVAFLAQSLSGNIASHAIRGSGKIFGTSNQASGLVGAANGYDFYAEGSGTNYGPFTGAHDALVTLDCPAVEGDIMVDVQCISKSNLSNTIFKVVPSTVVNQKAAVGVFVTSRRFVDGDIPAGFVKSRDGENVETTEAYSEAQGLYRIAAVNALGEGQINVCDEGGDIEAGDFIVTSSIPGKGMRQADDVLHNYTVAKARESVTFTPGEIKQIACIYLCG